MEWKYMGSENAGQLIEAMKSTTEAIGAKEPADQVELLDAAVVDIQAVIGRLRAPVKHDKCSVCNRPATRDAYGVYHAERKVPGGCNGCGGLP